MRRNVVISCCACLCTVIVGCQLSEQDAAQVYGVPEVHVNTPEAVGKVKLIAVEVNKEALSTLDIASIRTPSGKKVDKGVFRSRYAFLDPGAYDVTFYSNSARFTERVDCPSPGTYKMLVNITGYSYGHPLYDFKVVKDD